MKKKRLNCTKIFLFSILSIIILLFLIRLIKPTEIDDVTPGIPCPEIERYNPDILYIIPNYNNENRISENKEWCEKIINLDKEMQLHGISHIPYREFLYKQITQEELNKAILEFEECFNYSPEKFKPPQLKISTENKILIKNNNLILRNSFNQLTNKVYHCNDSGKISNKIIKIF